MSDALDPPRMTWVDVVATVVPGWLVISGVVANSITHGTSFESPFWFGAGLLPAFVLMGFGQRRGSNRTVSSERMNDSRDAASETPGLPTLLGRWVTAWFREVAILVGADRGHLEHLSRSLGPNRRALVATTRAPWFALTGFWLFLLLYALGSGVLLAVGNGA